MPRAFIEDKSKSETSDVAVAEKRGYQVTYWLITPDKVRRSFCIRWRKRDLTGKTIGHGMFGDEQTQVLDRVFREGKKSHSSVEKEYRRIIRELQEREEQLRGKLPILSENEVLLDVYWKKDILEVSERETRI